MIRGKVVLVPFPFDDFSGTKVRPAVCLTDFAATGLRVSSALRLHRLMTVPIPFLQRELGDLSPRMQDEVGNRLRKLFSLK